jgi:hypothetical protein
MLRTYFRCLAAFAAIAFLSGAVPAQDKLAQYRDRYEHETDPVRKAKAFQQLGDAQMAEFARAAAKDEYENALRHLSDYREEAHTCFNGLNAAVADAEKHPDGFRQLQIHLRKGLWEIERTIPQIPEARRQEFRTIHDDLAELQSKLIHALFPRDSSTKDKEKPRG